MSCSPAARLFLVGLAFATTVGCGDGDQGRFKLKGTVTYGEAAVPDGRISFVPDTTKGGSGPATVADITDGTFVTRAGRGVTSGPHHVIIYGTDGTEATDTRDNSLFAPYRTEAEVSENHRQIDFVVPKQ